MNEYYLGLMSGTSIDAIDAAIVQISEQKIKIIATHAHPIDTEIKQAIRSLCQPGNNEIDRMGELDGQLGALFATAASKLLEQSGIAPSQIKAIGSHGQTIRHHPDGKHPFTLQIGNPAIISQQSNITTIADFRRADMAAGGQGAPLVPAFHQTYFSHATRNRVVLNIGGMANISILPSKKDAVISGFDTGPGNVLLNAWINKQKNEAYDDNGNWASSHSYNETLLETLLSDPYFEKAPPKSTGRETFDLHWLNEKLVGMSKNIDTGIIQSTLCELSACSIADAIKRYAPQTSEILVCGGGAHNNHLLSQIHQHTKISIKSTSELGVDADYVEAAAFAWLAKQTLDRKPANLPAVTGAKHPVILGAIYPR